MSPNVSISHSRQQQMICPPEVARGFEMQRMLGEVYK
jgi:hypothetical protein